MNSTPGLLLRSFAALVLSPLLQAQGDREPQFELVPSHEPEAPATPGPSWDKSLEHALAEARAGGQQVLLYFTAVW